MEASNLCDRLSCNWLIRIKYDDKTQIRWQMWPAENETKTLEMMKCLHITTVWVFERKLSNIGFVIVFVNILCVFVDHKSTHGDFILSPSPQRCSILRRTVKHTNTSIIAKLNKKVFLDRADAWRRAVSCVIEHNNFQLTHSDEKYITL